MKMNTNYKQIKSYISSIEKYKIKSSELDENISINYKLLNEDINNIDKDLITNLIKDKLCKELFFDKIEDIYVFNQNSFIEVMFNTNEHKVGCYTKYSSDNGLFLKDKIQLNFPYKDCVLVGGMDKEDDKVNLEVFYNEILEKDKINKLFEPKVFHNIKKISYSKELSEDDRLDNPNNIQVDNDIDTIEFETIEEDGIEKEKLKDNLLIKGNNLIGLHSLAKRLSGSIDVIYIDPPYYFNKTKASDSFAYNSNFKLSTWLTFMKNRLEIAKKLLSDTGVIFISMNEDGNSHLKLLCNEIFNQENFIEQFIWEKNSATNNSKTTSTKHEYILCFSKFKKEISNGDFFKFRKKGYKEVVNLLDNCKNTNLDITTSETLLKELLNNNKDVFTKSIIHYKYLDNEYNAFSISNLGNPSSNAINKNDYTYDLFDLNGKKVKMPKRGWLYKEKDMLNKIKENLIYFSCPIPRLKKYLNKLEFQNMSSIILNFDDGYKEIQKIFNNESQFNFPKPMSLIKHLINSNQNNNSIILDFFAGSGTTGHAVMDLNKEDGGNRKFILLEQMDYIESITAERIKRCMIKEGYEDSFVYMEMKESNTKELKNSIKSSKSKEELISLINNNFDNKEQILLKIEEIYNQIKNKNITKTNTIEKFNNRFLLESIKLIIEKYMDNNLDYVSYEDIEELKQSNKIKENEYKLNKSFYEEL